MALSPEEKNKLMRELLTRNSPKVLKQLPAVTGAMGSTIRCKLNNTGLITRLFADIQIPYNASVAPTSIGNKGILAAVPKVQLLDFDGQNRINSSAFLLALRNAIRGSGGFMNAANLQSEAGFTSVAEGQSNDFRHPQISLATGAQTLRFMLELPVAAHTDKGDLRGMLPAQFTSGELYATFDIAAALTAASNDDYVFSGGTMTYGTPSVTIWQEYYLPQVIGGINPIPELDIGMVYELAQYTRTTDNIQAGADKIINFPLVRQVNALYVDFINNALLGGGSATNDLAYHQILANGNTTLYQSDSFIQNCVERVSLGHDLPQGVNVFDFANGPISTAIFGNVQALLRPNAAATLTNPAIETMFESFYPKGSNLSGLTT